MIFVTVGHHENGFPRLIKKMDEVAPRLNHEVIMQIGHTPYIPHNTKWFRFTSEEMIRQIYQEADVVIAHAGAGTILTVLKYQKPLILVPRLRELGEHIDDHQKELAQILQRWGVAFAVYDIERLEEAIELALLSKKRTIRYQFSKKLSHRLREYIQKIQEAKEV
ncbi:MAG: beta-1,4-galactosyltransferase [Candidatus Marinimicrobia bacterium]|nr:beta-1,4-galactosyltransferase [Candidatus Neomarinimicrobiota bacterium]